MALVRRDPWRDIDDIFERYSRAVGWPRGGRDGAEWAPSVDIAETDAAYVIKAELPEVDRKDVKVSVENGVLTLSGERKQESEESGKKFHRVERMYGSFARSFTLPDNVDPAKIKATFKDGMLNVELPKTAPAKPSHIDVQVA